MQSCLSKYTFFLCAEKSPLDNNRIFFLLEHSVDKNKYTVKFVAEFLCIRNHKNERAAIFYFALFLFFFTFFWKKLQFISLNLEDRVLVAIVARRIKNVKMCRILELRYRL